MAPNYVLVQRILGSGSQKHHIRVLFIFLLYVFLDAENQSSSISTVTVASESSDSFPDNEGDTLASGTNPYAKLRQADTKAYISYARYSDDHTDSVMALTSWLCDHGINAICDMYCESEASQNLPAFIESHLPTSDFIIAVCSPSYKQCWETPNGSQQSTSQCHIHTKTTQENSLSRLGLMLYEVFLTRNLLFQAGPKPGIIPVQLPDTTDHEHVNDCSSMDVNISPQCDIPVALRGFRCYTIGSMHPDHVLDQRDLLYRLHDMPIFVHMADSQSCWDQCDVHCRDLLLLLLLLGQEAPVWGRVSHIWHPWKLEMLPILLKRKTVSQPSQQLQGTNT